jgi:hypothetical protein
VHGHWEQPETVVLGIRSYDKVLGDAHAQTVQSALGLMKSFLFVGCGAGLVDPNLGALLQWIRKVLAGSEYRHFRLCRDAEIDEVQKLHPPEERIFPVRYGATHADLASFLRRLSPPLFRPATSSFRQSATWRIERPRGGDPGATLYDQEIETAHETPAQTTLDSTSHRKNSKTSVFISYCHRDNRWRQRLDIHLKPIVESGLIASWHDGLIDPGRKWREEKQLAIETAKIAILLVSADFLASDFIRRNELPPLLKAAESRGCRILPIIVRPCRFSRTPEISQFQAFNPPERPLSAMNANERESLFARVADIIENIFWTRCIADVIDHVVHAGFEINDRPDRNVFQIQGVSC